MTGLKTKALKTGHLYSVITLLVVLFHIQTAGAATLASCSYYPATGSGDFISRAFYVPNYNGINLQQVTLLFSSDTAGSFTFSLTAHAGTFNGPVIGTASATVSLASATGSYVPATFDFGSVPVIPGSTVAFVISKTGGPGGSQYFHQDGFSDDPTCPVIETEDSTPPLSTYRMQGIDIIITGDQQSIPTMTEWGMIIFTAIAGLGAVYYLRRQKRANS